MDGKCVIFMGVSGCGKTTMGKEFALRQQMVFIDGDDLHSVENIKKMHAGQPLTDEDRAGWLLKINHRIREITNGGMNCVIGCSALKRKYRDQLSDKIRSLIFVFLKGSYEQIHARMIQRTGHYMPPALLSSQFEALEEPQEDEKNVVTIFISNDFEKDLACIETKLHERFT